MPKIVLSKNDMRAIIDYPTSHDIEWPNKVVYPGPGQKPLSLALTYTKLKDFESCPRKFMKKHLTHEIPYTDTPATLWGTHVHSSYENYVLNDQPLPKDVREKVGSTAPDKIIDIENKLYDDGKLAVPLFGEQKWAMDATGRYANWMDSKGVFMRGMADAGLGTKKVLYMFDYKGLALDTPIPTPDGFTTMGEIAVGDVVYDHTGQQCQVIGKSEVKHLRCFAVTVETGETIICDEEHLWLMADGSVRNVQDIEFGTPGKTSSLPVPGALRGGHTDVPVTPYTLGMWLADGRSRGGEICKPYTEVWDKIRAEGWSVGNDVSGREGGPFTATVYGLTTALRKAGLIHNKRIPATYFRANEGIRQALLSGLMDGDGTVNVLRKQLIYCTTSFDLANDVAELVRTLGNRAYIHAVKACGFGVETVAYQVCFRAFDFDVFSIAHKRDAELKVKAIGYKQQQVLRTLSIEEVDSVPTQCILVDSPDHTFLCGKTYIPTHNTGKDKNPDVTQFDVLSLLAVAQPQFTQYTDIRGMLMFVEARSVYPKTGFYQVDMTPGMGHLNMLRLWQKKAIQVVDYYQREYWPEKQSVLCKWCPDKTCPFNTSDDK